MQVQAAGSAAKAMGANVKLAEAMGSTAQTMGQMNRMMNPAQVELFSCEFFAPIERRNFFKLPGYITCALCLCTLLVF
jgi:hypothetical protein